MGARQEERLSQKEEKISSNKEILLTRTFEDSCRFKEMLQREKFNGKVLIFPLLEIEFQNISVNIEKADILVFTSVYAAEKLYLEFNSDFKSLISTKKMKYKEPKANADNAKLTTVNISV